MRDDLLTYLAKSTPGDTQTFAKACVLLKPAVIEALQARAWQHETIEEFIADCEARAEGKRIRRKKVKA